MRFLGLDVDWEREVLVTSGATEALADAFLGLLNPGDEAIVFEPVYDSYGPILRRGGVKPVPVRLVPPQMGIAARRACGGDHVKDSRDRHQHADEPHRQDFWRRPTCASSPTCS